jgi:hypothetical protein
VSFGDRPHGGQPLQVEQPDADHGERQDGHPPAVRERQHGGTGEHAEPERVLAERRRHDERADQHAEIEQPTRPQRPPPGRQQRDARGRDHEHRPERARREAVRAALGEQQVEADAAGERRDPEPGGRRPGLAAVGQHACGRDEQQEHAGHGAGEHRGQPERAGEHAAAAARGRPRADGERDPEQERHPPDRHVGEHAGREQPGGDRPGGARRRRLARERDEERDRGDGRQHAHDGGTDRGGQRREQQRVAEHVMPAVPLRVPDGQALVLEQPGAIRVRRHVRGRRLCEQVRQAHQRTTQRRRERVLERAPHGGKTLAGLPAGQREEAKSAVTKQDCDDARRATPTRWNPRESTIWRCPAEFIHIWTMELGLQRLIQARFSPTRRDRT